MKKIALAALLAALLLSGLASVAEGGPWPTYLPPLRDLVPAAGQIQGLNVPILLFHHLSETAGNSMTVTPGHFEAVMAAVAQAGYTAIDFEALVAYADTGRRLPEKPVLITFDDGYLSNVTLAAPILEAHGLRATVFVIGISAGCQTYKDTGVPILPHFSWEQAAQAAPVLDVQSHSHDLHHVYALDKGSHYRRGVLPRPGETEAAYRQAFTADFQRAQEDITARLGRPALAYAYPYGLHTDETELMLAGLGIRATVLAEAGRNNVVPGAPETLFSLFRLNVTEDTTPQAVLEYLARP